MEVKQQGRGLLGDMQGVDVPRREKGDIFTLIAPPGHP